MKRKKVYDRALKEISLTKLEILIVKILDYLKESQILVIKKRFCYLDDGTTSMYEKQTGLQRRIRNAAPHSIYINCGCHRLAFCFKHPIPIPQFTWLSKLGTLFLGLWKMFHFSCKKKHFK